MNVIKKYWDSVYVYVLLLVPGLCMCAGLFWTVCKLLGLYGDLQWAKIIAFDCSQLLYFSVAFYFIFQNKKDPSYIPGHLVYVKGFIVSALFIQYNFILHLFASVHVWECTFLFFAVIVFLFDSRLMFFNIISYFLSLTAAHLLRPADFLPLGEPNLKEIIAFRLVIFTLTALCIMLIVYFVDRFLMQARESDEENMELLEKQLTHYRDMELWDTELRKFRHDIQNHFICMESLLKNEKMNELQDYFADLQHSFAFEQNLFFSGNDIIDAILHYDLPHSCKEEVDVTIYGSLPVLKTVSAMDLCTVFSNLLSNAIASANQCAEFFKPQIAIRFSGGRTYFSIAISNSALAQENKKPQEKPDRNHGFGIRKITSVTEKYGGRIEQNRTPQTVSVTVYLPI